MRRNRRVRPQSTEKHGSWLSTREHDDFEQLCHSHRLFCADQEFKIWPESILLELVLPLPCEPIEVFLLVFDEVDRARGGTDGEHEREPFHSLVQVAGSLVGIREAPDLTDTLRALTTTLAEANPALVQAIEDRANEGGDEEND